MAYTLSRLKDLLDGPFDEIIDVRSPGEFAEDHLPGALNLPVLDDEERARVGTIYKQESAFRARKIGGALVARRAGLNIETHLLEKPGSYRPLVYCWRGGMRSGSFATILKQIGWRAETLDGGYKSFRRAVVKLLHAPAEGDAPLAPRLVVLDGNTGTAKTDLLHLMAARGAQVLDLEGLAGHRGSLFGALERPQPTQKAFDTALAMQLVKFDPVQPILVEAESSRIGQLTLPGVLWAQMRRAPRIRIEAGLAPRGAYLAQAYADIANDRDRLARVIDQLRPYHAADRIGLWHDLAREGRTEDLARELVARHYDPKYARQRARDTQLELGTVTLSGFDSDALEIAAQTIIALAQHCPGSIN
ncbi:MAG: tRNA 2-selenouridine(34) synthase MnmH [Pannonibacter sp.]